MSELNDNELRAAVEAILFASPEPVRVEDLAEALGNEPRERIEAGIEQIRATIEQQFSGIALEKVAGGWRFIARPEMDPHLRRFFASKKEGRLSMAALETLSIVAYRQPITAPEVTDIRGVNSSAVIRTLLDRRMIRIAGRKNVVGSPFLYRTTKEFLLHFGLDSIQDLPNLDEFTEILGETAVDDALLEGIAHDRAGASIPTEAVEDGGARAEDGVWLDSDEEEKEAGELTGPEVDTTGLCGSIPEPRIDPAGGGGRDDDDRPVPRASARSLDSEGESGSTSQNLISDEALQGEERDG